jgi:hypothetical protein
MPKQKSQQTEVSKRWGQLRHYETARKVELYSQLALQQISLIQMREQPDIYLRTHASIRRQPNAGETDPRVIAFDALKEVKEKARNGRKRPSGASR